MAMIPMNHDFQKFIDPAFYFNIISTNDEAGCILKLQLLSERFLEVYLDERIPENSKKFFKKGRGDEILKYFDEKLMVSIAFGLPVEFAEALKCLNKIRNGFGHNFDQKLRKEDLDKFIDLAELFKVKAAVPYAGDEDIRGTRVKITGKVVTINDSFIAGFVIATYCLMTRAGLWLVSDLKQRGQLKLGQPLKE
ncbi:hypothetical protein ACMVCI_001611 [Yersinia enterocolitica]|nr:hypothetical protein [Yersinia enterocolitica]EKN4062777.1 hypothetical protein [Yersinia enterocolitica]HEK7315665.1 hypothetical protein [Yersinia enterocolitica]